MKKALNFMIILVFSVLLCGANLTTKVNAPQTVKLAYNPKAGSSTKYLMMMTAATIMEGQSKEKAAVPIKSTTKVNATFTQKINKVDTEGNIDMSVTYNDVSFELEQAGEKTSIPLGDKIAGRSTQVRISKDGKILEMKGLGGDLPAELKDFNIQKLYPQVNPSFPAGELKMGDTWTQNVEETTPLAEGVSLVQKMKIDYTLTGLSELKGYKCAVIGMKVKMNITGRWDKKTENNTGGVGLESSGEGTGVMNYAYNASKLVDSKMDMNVNSLMKIGSGAQAQESKIKQNITINMEMVR